MMINRSKFDRHFKVRYAVIAFSLALPALLVISCSASPQRSSEPLRIELYSGGGFAGLYSGIEITDDGWARRWKRIGMGEREYSDSTTLSIETLRSLDSLLTSRELFETKYERTGNISTILDVEKGPKSLHVSFAGKEVPAELPSILKTLIQTVKTSIK